MVILRPTQKLRNLLPTTNAEALASETALGDWYVNRMVVDRRPLLLFVSSIALLPLLVPARDVRSIPDRLPELVGAALRRLRIAPHLIAAELAAMMPVATAPTRDRSVLGVLVDTAKSVPFHLDVGLWDETTLPFVEAKLARTPWRCSGRAENVVFPDQATPRLLEEKWGAR
ncbi:MAG: hypothetical protein IBJ03_06380 [Gemmatimonadaceae bacterium]|nr:hypothetical protein [Gemmatimonadaceae bacterium]